MRTSRQRWRQARPAVRCVAGSWVEGVAAPGHVRRGRRCGAARCGRRARVRPWPAGAGWRGRRAGFRVPRRPGGCADPDPVRLLQAGRGADRRAGDSLRPGGADCPVVTSLARCSRRPQSAPLDQTPCTGRGSLGSWFSSSHLVAVLAGVGLAVGVGRPDGRGHRGAAWSFPFISSRGQHGRGWAWPLTPTPPTIVRPFDPPPRRWESGHRGVDLPSARSAGRSRRLHPGQVVFASQLSPVAASSWCGMKVGSEHVRAGGQPRTRNDRHEGQAIGRVMDGPSHCAPRTCLHRSVAWA